MKKILDLLTDPYIGLLINVGLMIVALISVSDVIRERRLIPGTILRRRVYTRRGRSLIISASLVVLFSFWKDCNHEKKEILSQNRQEDLTEQNKKDIVKAVDSAHIKVDTALAKFYLAYEKKSDSIVKFVRDSAKGANVTQQFAAPDVDPNYSLTVPLNRKDYPGIKISQTTPNEYLLKFYFTSYLNSSCDININVIVTGINGTDSFLVDKLLMINHTTLKDAVTSLDQFSIASSRPLQVKILYIRFIGTYANCKSLKRFRIDHFEALNVEDGSYGDVFPDEYKPFDNYIYRKSEMYRYFKKHKVLKLD